jgi:DNA polymerase-3 subunit beta
MLLTVASEDLASALTEAGSVTDSRNPSPLLRHVRLCAVAGTVEVAGQSISGSLATTVACKTERPGAVLVDHRELTNRIRAAGDEVPLELRGTNLLVRGTTKKVRYSMGIIDADDWPTLPKSDGVASGLPAKTLLECIARVGFAVSTDRARALSALFLRGDGKELMAVGVDGHRLAIFKVPFDGAVELDVGVGGVERLKRLLVGYEGDVELNDCGNSSFATFGSTVLSFARTQRYLMPPIEHVIPLEFQGTVALMRDELKEAVQAAALAGVDRDKDGKIIGRRDITLSVSFGELGLHLMSRSAEFGEADADLPEATCEADVLMGANSRYLLEALATCDADVTLGVIDENSPLTLNSGPVKHIIMPTRL